MVDLEDKEGETALHKATLHGYLDIVIYFLSIPHGKADVHARDADGWTPLHNAASKGYLDIVKWLCEKGGAAEVAVTSENTGTPVTGINRKSVGGWTPLMNASSKGHLPVVLYLLTKQMADPLVRNNWGETAYDVAAAVFEVWICEILQKAEAVRWHATRYNSLAVHTTVSLIVHENQRLDARLKTLAVAGGRPKFSASGLGRRETRSPFELRLPAGSDEQGRQDVPAWRSDVQLPLTDDPFQLPKPKANRDVHLREGGMRSHFWLSDWTLDSTHPKVDVQDGWQYANTFDDPDDRWSAEMPPALERLLSRSGVISPTLGSASSFVSQSAPNGHVNGPAQLSWVRRRRWVRVMRRRLDIPPLPFMEPDGSMYQVSGNGVLVPFVHDDPFDPDGGQELGSMPQSYLSFTQDYVSRARYLAGSPHDNDLNSVENTSTPADVRKIITKLERAVLELRAGDDDTDRKTQAEVLLNAYSRELERRRLTAGADGLFRVENEEDVVDDDDASEGSFHYPTSLSSSSARPTSVHSHTTDYFSNPPTSRTTSDITPQLSQAPEFRVPTHESPQNILTPRAALIPHSIHAQWERDESVAACPGCSRRFTFLFRKVNSCAPLQHCRRCGRIFCDKCSSRRSILDPDDIVRDPAAPDGLSSNSLHRVCLSCYDITNANVPGRFQGLQTASMERIVVDQGHLAVPNTPRGEISSQISDLSDCPVCGQNLAELGAAELQEAHVKACLEGPSGGSATEQPVKYLVYRLPAESALIGVECVICLEEFVRGSLVARLSCLCSFHNTCLSAWLKRGKFCPSHSR
ncbi:hypothetical protein JB92DRAFT_2750329 [Gautieria morchelliformis]|nr:hypothetical protein JB92DRAFT_2750329 [Gautieria morchelliformis]